MRTETQTRNIPSRTFMVQQAVLNAIEYWKPFYTKNWLRGWDLSRPLPKNFYDQVRREYRAIASRYLAEASI